MQRPTSIVLASFTAFLVLFPLTLVKPGWPSGLKADEPAYFMMALSLARDFDLRVELHDLRRLFDEFPNHETRNVILMTDDGWNTVYFGKPYLYSLFAAPMAGLFGSNGLVSFNMALLAFMVWLGAKYLARYNAEGIALLFSAGFFALSAGFAYAFWLHPEVFNMAAITACLYLGLCERREEKRFLPRRWTDWTGRPLVRQLASGAALALAVYNKPMLAAMGLPVFFLLATKKRFKEFVAWLAGAALCLALAAGVAMAFTGHPSAYLGVARAGVDLCSPHEMPIQPIVPPPPVEKKATGKATDTATAEPERGSLANERRASWFWLLRVPDFYAPKVLEHFGYFLWGRHTGLFLYFPFSLLALVLFLAHARRSGLRWVLLGSLAIVAVFFLLWIPFNWHGGGGFVGNRYFVNVYPGFLFLVTRIAPSWLTVVGYAAGSLLLGPTIFTPMGRSVSFPTLQAHVRNFPFTHFPFELGIKGIPGYHETRLAGTSFRGRKDVFLPRDGSAWLGGATTTEVWIRLPEPVDAFVFRAESFAAPNVVTLALGGHEVRLEFAEGEAGERRRFELRPKGPTRIQRQREGPLYYYRLEVTSLTGEVREWIQHYPPRDCYYFPYFETSVERFYAGAEIAYLGTPEHLAKDLYAVSWGRIDAPEQVEAGTTFTVRTRVRNKSEETWPVSAPTRVNLAYHWEDAGGNEVVRNGLRTFLERPVAPGELLEADQDVAAPDEPGLYVLVLDPVFEEVSWFSSKNGGKVARIPVEVMPGGNPMQNGVY